MCGVRIQFHTVGIRIPDDISCIFYDRQLHSQTQSQEGNPMGSCILNRQDLAFDTPGTEAAGYQDTVAVT